MKRIVLSLILCLPMSSELFAASPSAPASRRTLIPVYFHVINKGPDAVDGNVPDALLARQIEVLNASYRGLSEIEFRFVMGGITRTTNRDWYVMTRGSDAEKAARKALHQGEPAALNFYIADLPPGLDGWTMSEQQDAGEPLIDGVVVDRETLSEEIPSPLGEASVREVGRWLGINSGHARPRLKPSPTLTAVPDWFGNDDSGAGVALTDLDGNGQPELIAFFIDNPPGANVGYYRILYNIDQFGFPTGGWTTKSVPGWFGNDSAGGDITIADVNGNGRPDLIVYHIDDASGENHGYYRIGFDVDANGNAAFWTSHKSIPGWFGATDQGAGVAFADVNGNGIPELIFFFLVNPSGGNWGYYRIGWDTNTSGNPTSWSDSIQVPGWFGDDSNEAGIVVRDLNDNGVPDLVVFWIDNASGENHGYYRIGLDLGASGTASMWTAESQVPGWFGADNDGAGIALADLDGNGLQDFVVFFIADSPGANTGHYRVGWSEGATWD
jgi:hypothetical protein